MKKIFWMAVAMMGLVSCEHIDLSDEINENGNVNENVAKKRFTFTVKGDFENPTFSDASLNGEDGGATRANSYMTADGVEMTDLWVIDCVNDDDDDNDNLTVKQVLHQVPTDADWGKPQMQLSLGRHHVMFLASRGVGAQYEDGVVSWTKMNDTFWKDYEVEVVSTSNGNRAVTLDRVATRLKVTIDDGVKTGTTQLGMVPELWYTGWNMVTGRPVASDGYSVAWDIPSSYWNVQGMSVTMWGLSGQEEWTTDVTLTSKAGSAVNAEAALTDVPLVANRTTAYHGRLYSSASESSISLMSEWQQDYEGVY